ncbi:phosphopantothenoylcysteine decarboxylase [Rubinisphaera sp.]|uniref:phosphopantothenoylcysteine decarboxylase n=1 Tax=Rubinisphaera sp. TaxID=2024857 RepID=UPI000C0DB2DB|nr:phosphopantothenoylcysteine decarboxylase [Rubinisphaera sp.]MBV09744.1 flavoprotein [Rubinisphaera sp.]|tara:strand:- start:1809 stop:2438 length:630 start_codon:yes stop_codon:yes gene_type:complete
MRILVTAGPTREYIDDVRYISNASSGRMGYAIVQAILHAGHEAILVSGPVSMTPPVGCEYHAVESTEQMMQACQALFPNCDGVIAAAAVCDYQPKSRVSGKISKTGTAITLEMIETDDVLAALGKMKDGHWILGFALEAQNERENALQKLRRKNCNWIVLNRPEAIAAENNTVELLDDSGKTVAHWTGLKTKIAEDLVAWLEENAGQVK